MNTFGNIRFSRMAVAVIVLLAMAASVIAVRAAVTLAYFIARGLDTSVELSWETATELDNAGFFVRRGTVQTGPFTRISAVIPSRGDSLTGATYVFTDTNVVIGTIYWYQLETIDYSQNSQFYDPVSAVPGAAAATQTALAGNPATATRTATPTATSAPATATRTPTVTLQPSATSAYPGPATSTQGVFQPSPTSAGSGVITTAVAGTLDPNATSTLPGIGIVDPSGATATLVPLPEFTLEFATATPDEATPAAIAMAQEDNPQKPPPSSSADSGWLTPGRLLFLGFILLVWVILGVWFFFSMKRVQ